MPSDRKSDNRHKSKHRNFQLNIRKRYFTVRMVKHKNRLSVEVVEFLCWELFKTEMNEVLGNMLVLTLLWAGIWACLTHSMRMSLCDNILESCMQCSSSKVMHVYGIISPAFRHLKLSWIQDSFSHYWEKEVDTSGGIQDRLHKTVPC